MTTRFAARCRRIGLTSLVLLGSSTLALAGDRFVSAAWSDLRFEGEAPKLPASRAFTLHLDRIAEPYAVLDGPSEVFLHFGADNPTLAEDSKALMRLSIRADEDVPLKGRLFLPKEDSTGFTIHRFHIEAAANPDARRQFYEDMEAYYTRLLQQRFPGSAWFRHRENEAQRALGKIEAAVTPNPLRREPADPLDLFTGARAVAENLSLDRNLRVPTTGEATIDIETITGVTTKSLDWKTLIEGKKPDLDPLAKLVPGDQHAVFFPTFDAMTRVFDEIDKQGTPLLEFFDARVEDMKTKERYQEQLLQPLSTLGRMLGPSVVSSVALTGSDPFLPSGTDIVLLFDCKQPALLESMLGARRSEAARNGAQLVEGMAGALKYTGASSPDRRVSSYVARIESTVVVTNSLRALTIVAATAADPARSIAAAEEYVWFRDRYRRGEEKESALLVLTDATIRRWAGPAARIGDARRLRAAAAMAEIQARHVDELVSGKIELGAKATDAEFPVSADFVWTKSGVYSPTWGALDALTPVSELDTSRVSAAEK